MSKPKEYRRIGGAEFYQEIQPKNDGPGFWGWAVIAFIGLLLLGQCAG